MSQKTCYLYEYIQGRKIRNVGFMKLQNQGKQIRMHIYGKGIAVGNEEYIHFHMFYVQDEHCMTALLGQLRGKNGTINCMVDIDEQQLPKGTRLEQMEGVILEKETGAKYAAVFKPVVINVEHMVPIPVPTQEEMKVEGTTKEGAAQKNSTQPITPEKEVSEQSEAKEKMSEDTLRTQEVGEREEWAEQQKIKYRKIQRQDISRLPRKEWRVANNSFLLHGYYNYHHLIFIEEIAEDEEILWLGVPGIYHEKEQTAARHFGFSEFKRIPSKDLRLEAREKNEQEDFGYWCRQVNQCNV